MMDKEIRELRITGFGENGTLLRVARENQRRTTLILRNLGVDIKARGITMIEFGSRKVDIKLPRNGTTRKQKRVQLRALVKEINIFVKKINSRLGITIVEGMRKNKHPGWKCNYINNPSKNHFH